MKRQISKKKNWSYKKHGNTSLKSFARHKLPEYMYIHVLPISKSTNVNNNLHQIKLSLVTPILLTYKVSSY